MHQNANCFDAKVHQSVNSITRDRQAGDGRPIIQCTPKKTLKGQNQT